MTRGEVGLLFREGCESLALPCVHLGEAIDCVQELIYLTGKVILPLDVDFQHGINNGTGWG